MKNDSGEKTEVVPYAENSGKAEKLNGDPESTRIDTVMQRQFIGKYPVIKVLGKGGMGAVYLGHHPELDIPVAIKAIHKAYAGNCAVSPGSQDCGAVEPSEHRPRL